MLQKIGMLLGCVGILVVVAAVALFVLAKRATPLPAIGETLASLPSPERAALTTVCELAGVPADSLRPVGSAMAYVFKHESNRAAVHVRDGHVRALGLHGRTFTSVPDFTGLPSLEALWLENGKLPDWPDLSSLGSLTELQLGGQPLGTPPPGRLPASLRILGLARTSVAGVAPLAALTSLESLDLSGTPVADFSALLPLRLSALDLSKSKTAALPPTLPAAGAWKVDLTDTPVTNPPGFSWKGPGSWSFTGTALGRETRSGGLVGAHEFVVTGTGSEVPALRPVQLPTNRQGSSSIGTVVVEASVDTGRARIWLTEPPGAFSSPWFTKGHVKGFGFVRPSGYVVADVAPGETARLKGQLMLAGPIEHHDFHFLIEPLDGSTVTGLRYRVASENPGG